MWMVALPVVLLGAPIGSAFNKFQPRKIIRKFMIAVLVFQFIAGMSVIKVNTLLVCFSILIIGLGLCLFELFKRLGDAERTQEFMKSKRVYNSEISLSKKIS